MDQDTHKQYNAADLFEQLQSNSQDALAGIVLLYRKRLMAYILIYIPDHQIATEIFNETMLLLWMHRHKVTAFNNPYAWLVSVAYHRALNKLRDEKSYNAMVERSAIVKPIFTSIEARVEYKELVALIDRAAQQLPAREKMVFDLFIQNGWSNVQIARYCGTSENTVRNQLNNAIKKIRKKLIGIMHGIFF